MAALHAACFGETPRPWSAAEFASMLAAGAFAVTCPGGLAVGRVAGTEAELLTLCVAPDGRRRGTGALLLARFEAEGRARGAREAVLEVAETNGPALALYAAAGWVRRGFRKDYYSADGRRRIGALVLGKALGGD
jgi:ribosomal-protein-alanine N-acetyltransferase